MNRPQFIYYCDVHQSCKTQYAFVRTGSMHLVLYVRLKMLLLF